MFFQASLLSEDYGRHLLDVEDLLQKHSMVEADIAAQEDRIKVADEQANMFLEMEPEVEGEIYFAIILFDVYLGKKDRGANTDFLSFNFRCKY